VLEKKLEAMQENLQEKEHIIKELTSLSSLSLNMEKQSDLGFEKLQGEQRKKTVVKMNFDSEENKERSRSSSADQVVTEEKLSAHSISSRLKSQRSSISAVSNSFAASNHTNAEVKGTESFSHA